METVVDFLKKNGKAVITVGLLSFGSLTVGWNQGCFTDFTPAPTEQPAK
jgi:predicted negative regulator of RcsB-dependent stress response